MERSNFFVGLLQLIVALLLYFHLEPQWLGNSVHITRDAWIILFIVGGFCFTGFGLYRTYRPRVTTRNIENRVREWLLAVQLPPTDHVFQLWHFTYIVMFRGVRIFVGRPRSMSGRWLQVEARITPIPSDLAPTVAKMDNAVRTSFYQALIAEAARARILFHWNNPNDLSITKSLPITDQLSDAGLLDALTDVYLSAMVIWMNVRFWLEPIRDLESQPKIAEQPPSPATEAQNPPPATQPSPKSDKAESEQPGA